MTTNRLKRIAYAKEHMHKLLLAREIHRGKGLEDSDPKHTAEIVKLWLLCNIPNQLHTSPKSPDLIGRSVGSVNTIYLARVCLRVF
ncbi:hypothetical protein TNCV_4318431 [Trichonephila clavipes]|nr:hypothetical protein TNCV_4318431 [Trichonephila clavipes]